MFRQINPIPKYIQPQYLNYELILKKDEATYINNTFLKVIIASNTNMVKEEL
jgi:hypothetical protein